MYVVTFKYHIYAWLSGKKVVNIKLFAPKIYFTLFMIISHTMKVLQFLSYIFFFKENVGTAFGNTGM